MLLDELKRKKNAYKICFTSESGREVLEDLRRRSYVDYTTFSKDGMEMAYREGIRSVYLHIERMMKDDIKPEVKEG